MRSAMTSKRSPIVAIATPPAAELPEVLAGLELRAGAAFAAAPAAFAPAHSSGFEGRVMIIPGSSVSLSSRLAVLMAPAY